MAKKHAEGVFVGKVTRSERVAVDPTDQLPFFKMYQMRLTVQVELRFKGRTMSRGGESGDSVIVYTGVGGGDCGYEFQVGERYVIYTSDGDEIRGRMSASRPLWGRGIYWTSICTRTRRFDEAEIRELEALE